MKIHSLSVHPVRRTIYWPDVKGRRKNMNYGIMMKYEILYASLSFSQKAWAHHNHIKQYNSIFISYFLSDGWIERKVYHNPVLLG